MRKVISAALAAVLTVLGAPFSVFAAPARPGGTLKGVAQGADKKPLPRYTVQVRNVTTGQIAGTTTSTEAGAFSFTGLAESSYVVEIVDAPDKIEAFIPDLEQMVGDGLITLERAEVILYRPGR